MKLELPFEIGDTYYAPLKGAQQVSTPCSVCNGARKVTLVEVLKKQCLDY